MSGVFASLLSVVHGSHVTAALTAAAALLGLLLFLFCSKFCCSGSSSRAAAATCHIISSRVISDCEGKV